MQGVSVLVKYIKRKRNGIRPWRRKLKTILRLQVVYLLLPWPQHLVALFFSSFFQAVRVSHGVRTSVHGLCCCALKLQVMFGGSSEGHARFWKHPSTPPSSPLPVPTSNTQIPLPTNVWNRAKQGPNISIYVHVYIHRYSRGPALRHTGKRIYHCGSTSVSRSKSHACKFDKTRSKSSRE